MTINTFLVKKRLSWSGHVHRIDYDNVVKGNRKGSVYIVLFISTSVYVILRRNLGKHIQNQCVTSFHKAKKAVKNCL